MTKEERHLWYDFFRDYPHIFVRQKVMGKFISDFYCAKAGFVIELDGSQHYEPTGMEHDTERTRYLGQFGVKVLRIPNSEVSRNSRGVCEYIYLSVRQAIGKDDDMS